MKVKVTLEAEIIIELDEQHPDFEDLFINFNDYYTECDKEEFAEYIAGVVAMYGLDDDIEGVGRPKINGKMQEGIDHPVNIIVNQCYLGMNHKIEFDVSSEDYEDEDEDKD